MILFRVSNENGVVYAVAITREPAKRAARQTLGLNPDEYVVDPITPSEEFIEVVHGPDPRIQRFDQDKRITFEQVG